MTQGLNMASLKCTYSMVFLNGGAVLYRITHVFLLEVKDQKSGISYGPQAILYRGVYMKCMFRIHI